MEVRCYKYFENSALSLDANNLKIDMIVKVQFRLKKKEQMQCVVFIMLGIRFKFGILCKAGAFTRILFKILYSWSTFRYFGPFNNQSLACYIPVPFPCHTSSPAVSTAKNTEVDLMARLSFDPQKALCRNNPFQF